MLQSGKITGFLHRPPRLGLNSLKSFSYFSFLLILSLFWLNLSLQNNIRIAFK